MYELSFQCPLTCLDNLLIEIMQLSTYYLSEVTYVYSILQGDTMHSHMQSSVHVCTLVISHLHPLVNVLYFLIVVT